MNCARVDLQKHGRNYACLREVKPLSVMVEPGFLSNPEEGRRLLEAEAIVHEARAIVHGHRGLPGPTLGLVAVAGAGWRSALGEWYSDGEF